MEEATPSSWKNHPFPAESDLLDYRRSFSEEQFSVLKRGFVPTCDEDKCFCFFRDMSLNIVSAKTGYCIFKISFSSDGNEFFIDEVLVNRNKVQYSVWDKDRDMRILDHVISNVLLQEGKASFGDSILIDVHPESYFHMVSGIGVPDTEMKRLKPWWKFRKN